MSRRRKEENNVDESLSDEVEVVMRWSKKRIGIATVIVVLVIVVGLYLLSLMGERSSSILGETVRQPQIKIPNELNIEEVIENAKDDLADINADNIIESQPKIHQIIQNLTNLTNASGSAKTIICDAICK